MASNSGNDFPIPQLNQYMPSPTTQQLDTAAYTNPTLSLAAGLSAIRDTTAQEQYRGALQAALSARAQEAAQARNTDIMKSIITQSPAYAKQGIPLGLLGMYGNLGGAAIPSNGINAMQMFGLPAVNAGLDTQAAQAANQRAQSVKTMSDAGFKQLNPDNTVDTQNLAALTPYMNPGDRAAMTSAENAGASTNKPPSLMLPILAPNGTTAMVRFPNAAQATPEVVNGFQQRFGKMINPNTATNQAKTMSNVQSHMKAMLDDQELEGHGAQPVSQTMNDDGSITATYSYADGRTATYNIDQNGNVLAQ